MAKLPGHLYLRGRIYWIKYSVDGQPRYESTETDDARKARDVLLDRVGRVKRGEPILPRVDKIRYPEAAEDLRTFYKTSGQRDLEEAEYRLAHLDAFFKPYRLRSIGASEITKYIAKRQGEQAANGTINRE